MDPHPLALTGLRPLALVGERFFFHSGSHSQNETQDVVLRGETHRRRADNEGSPEALVSLGGSGFLLEVGATSFLYFLSGTSCTGLKAAVYV